MTMMSLTAPGLLHSFRWLPALIAALLIGLSAPASAGDTKLAPPDWKLLTERDGIKVYVRHGELSKLKTFKGVTRMKIRDEYVLATVLNDYESFPKWLYMFDGAQEVRRDNPLHRYLYLTTDLPWPVANRDMGVELYVRQSITPASEAIVIDIRNKDDLVPKVNGYVRVRQIVGTLTFRRVGNDEFDVTFEALFDPAGRLPMWLVNILASDIPHNTLSQLRRIVQKDDYPAQYIDYLELRGATWPKGMPAARSYIYRNPPSEPIPLLSLPDVNSPR